MPSLTHEDSIFPPCKKRRRDDIISSCEVQSQHAKSGRTPPRKILPLPTAKRQRVFEDASHQHVRSLSDPPTIPRHSQQQHQQEQLLPLQDTRTHAHNPPPPPPPWTGLQETDGNSRPRLTSTRSSPAAAAAALVARCHICHRRPSKLADLDSFADCQGCGSRTCYVCMRECLGWGPALGETTAGSRAERDKGEGENTGDAWRRDDDLAVRSFHMTDVVGHVPGDERASRAASTRGGQEQDLGSGNLRNEKGGWLRDGHRQMVCSRCCVERGTDGDVVCLGCLRFVDG